MACIFCQIIKGKVPCSKLYEDDRILAFLDISPVNKGHTLVVPKEHYKRISLTPDYILSDLALAIKRISKAVVRGVGADGFNLGLNSGRTAGQIVPHIHFHIIPRFKGDGLVMWPSKKYKEGEMGEVARKIRRCMPIAYLRIIYKINPYILIVGMVVLCLAILGKIDLIINKVPFLKYFSQYFFVGLLLILYSLIVYLVKTKGKKL